jgi:ATPase subunit of ABC transporter with duplicated ATPase domains
MASVEFHAVAFGYDSAGALLFDGLSVSFNPGWTGVIGANGAGKTTLPTNHLDLPSIECLEAALGECVSALLLVSHDLRFLDKLTRTRWAVSAGGELVAGPSS